MYRSDAAESDVTKDPLYRDEVNRLCLSGAMTSAVGTLIWIPVIFSIVYVFLGYGETFGLRHAFDFIAPVLVFCVFGLIGAKFLVQTKMRRLHWSTTGFLVLFYLIHGSIWGAAFWHLGGVLDKQVIAISVSVQLSAAFMYVVVQSMRYEIFLIAFTSLASVTYSYFVVHYSSEMLVVTYMGPLMACWLLYLGWATHKKYKVAMTHWVQKSRLAEELRATVDDAEKANRAKSAFLANMSHELRTPLNAILGFSEVIMTAKFGHQAIDKYSEYAEHIHESGQLLMSHVSDLLDISKIEAGKLEIEPERLDIDELVAKCRKIVEPELCGKHHRLVYYNPVDDVYLFADEKAAKQILLNLLSNASKFTQTHGCISINVNRNDKDQIAFSVADDGKGIPPEDILRVLQPFERVDNTFNRDTGGTGLGLALSKALVELHGGTLWIESQVGQGTVVYFTLPLVEKAEHRSSSAA